LIAPGAGEAGGGDEFVGLCILSLRNGESAAIVPLRRLIASRVHQIALHRTCASLPSRWPFRNYGVDNVSVADVMGAVGMTIGGFYKHFESKDDLIQEAFSLAFRQASVDTGIGSQGPLVIRSSLDG
jgi:hypothetical protein